MIIFEGSHHVRLLMETIALSIHVSQTVGEVSAMVTLPVEPTAVYVFGHGAGAGMHHPFMESMATALAHRQIVVLRYNFPYMEKGKKMPDFPAIAEKTVAAAIAVAHSLYKNLPLFAGGKSFGGRMTSQCLSRGGLDYVKGLLFFGFPLHATGKPSVERAAHLDKISAPMLFLQGTRDKLADIALMEGVVDRLENASLETVEGADHTFKGSKQDSLPLLADAASHWIRSLI